MTERLFFALWPDGPLRGVLDARLPGLLEGVQGRPQRPDQWHVTLEFVGATAEDRVGLVAEAADGTAGELFELEFDRIDHWRRPQVLVLTATRTPPALAALVARLRASLAARGFRAESREFQPHVTLARKVLGATPAALGTPVIWPAESFALVRSVSAPAGSRYEPLRWWNLHGRTG